MRNGSVVSRIRWVLMPWWAFAWRYRNDYPGFPDPWWKRCVGSTAWWIDKALGRLPGGDLFKPMPHVVCDCDYCRGVPGAVFEP